MFVILPRIYNSLELELGVIHISMRLFLYKGMVTHK